MLFSMIFITSICSLKSLSEVLKESYPLNFYKNKLPVYKLVVSEFGMVLLQFCVL